MKKTLLALALASLPAVSAAMSDSPDSSPVDETVEYPAADTVVRFIAIGDSGTGKDGQYKVAAALEAVCAARCGG
ncbi:hypothetical protein [Bacterioplanoides pacificum]|uniref:Uncharacterized protein n=1 Tax=Bacterioplanoides pacificum TaxID=1171596 RepID=A0ABV7VV76_9GAMM